MSSAAALHASRRRITITSSPTLIPCHHASKYGHRLRRTTRYIFSAVLLLSALLGTAKEGVCNAQSHELVLMGSRIRQCRLALVQPAPWKPEKVLHSGSKLT